jgi:hypothetical protein
MEIGMRLHSIICSDSSIAAVVVNHSDITEEQAEEEILLEILFSAVV